MEDVFITIWTAVYDGYIIFLQSTTFFVIKIFLAIYTTVLVVDVLLLVYLSDVRNQLRKLKKGTSNTKVTKRADMREWSSIMDRLNSQDERQYRAAMLQADQFVYKSLETQGYSGVNFAERISQIPADSFASLEATRDVHALVKQIILKDDLRITKEQAQNALGVYEKFLRNLDIL